MKFIGVAITLFFALSSAADVRLPAIFGSHMVLQRDIALPVWGWADPHEQITVTFNGETQSTTADGSGKWRLSLRPVASGLGFTMIVKGKNTITLDNILIGDVWLCSGQSNMEMSVASSRDANLEINTADFPQIRLFTVTKAVSEKPLDDLHGQWVACSPKTVGVFSAVGYFFGRNLHKNVGLPVGLIHSSWGGTPAEAWTDLDAIKQQEILKPIADRYVASSPDLPTQLAEYQKKLQTYGKAVRQSVDPQNTGQTSGWANEAFDDAAWKTMAVPSAVEAALTREFDGAIWLRRTVDVPGEMAGKDVKLQLSRIDDWDTTYFNGQQVGDTGPEQDSPWNIQRSYVIPGKLIHAGKNVIAVRMFDLSGAGGVSGPAQQLAIESAGAASISIAGDWKYMIEKEITGVTSPTPPQPPTGARQQNAPSNLYNAMIHPIMPFAIKGAIWYQGESNASRAYQYRTLLPTMIGNWRTAWGQGDFPFLIVQLVNFSKDWTDANSPDAWAELREAQYLTAKNTANCGIAVGIDVGEQKDIHPKDKQSIGLRLALVARKSVYGQDVVDAGPVYKSVRIEGNKAIVSFDHVHGGLRSASTSLASFAVAGADMVYHFATAKIVGEVVEVASDQVAAPVAVRYAWGSNPVASLFNAEGLPAMPFRTDDWPLSTEKNR